MIAPAPLRAAVALVAAALAASAPAAEPQRVGAVEIARPWVRATLGTVSVTAGYMVLRSTDGKPDRLLGAATPAAERVELHAHAMEGGVARMREVPAIEVPGTGAVALEPGGFHLMIVGVKAPLAAGATIRLTLRFERAGVGEIVVPVAREAPAKP